LLHYRFNEEEERMRELQRADDIGSKPPKAKAGKGTNEGVRLAVEEFGIGIFGDWSIVEAERASRV
jgi:hypothetical protein